MPAMQQPGPDHPITIEPQPARVVVTAGGKIVADSKSALSLRESSYPPVQYIPRQDVDMTLLTRTEQRSYCPYKGECSYYSVVIGGHPVTAVWSYEAPYAAVTAIGDHLAFYPDRVDKIEQLP